MIGKIQEDEIHKAVITVKLKESVSRGQLITTMQYGTMFRLEVMCASSCGSALWRTYPSVPVRATTTFSLKAVAEG